MYYWLVPQGAEFQSVVQGLKRSPLWSSGSGGSGSADLLRVAPIALGANPVSDWLPPLLLCRPSLVVLWGLAGSLSPDLSVGDWVLSDEFHTLAGELAGEMVQGDRVGLQTLQTTLDQANAQPKQGAALTSDRVICRAAEKQTLAQTHPCTIVEMEGAIVAKTLAREHIPMVMIRVISDDLYRDLPDLGAALQPDGTLNGFALAQCFAQDPVGAFHLVKGSLHALGQLKTIASLLASSYKIRGSGDTALG